MNIPLKVNETQLITAASLALACVACSASPKAARASEAAGPVRVVYETRAPGAGLVCPTGWPGRGCSIESFGTACATYFSANFGEVDALKRDGYLNLRFRGDHAPKGVPSVLSPRRAHRAYVLSAFTHQEIGVLAEALGLERPQHIASLSDDLATMLARDDHYAATLYRLQPRLVRAIATLDSLPELRRAATSWDRVTRSYVGDHVEFEANSQERCKERLSQLTAIAKDAVASLREVYLVASLNHISDVCEGAECNGYGCGTRVGSDGAATIVCHSPADACFSVLDCEADEMCDFDPVVSRFRCVPPPDRSAPLRPRAPVQ